MRPKELCIIFGCNSLLDEVATGSKSEDSRTSWESSHGSNIVCIVAGSWTNSI